MHSSVQLRNCQRRPKCRRSLAREFLSSDSSPRFSAIKMLRTRLWSRFTNAFRKEKKREKEEERERERERGEPFLLSLYRDNFTDKARRYTSSFEISFFIKIIFIASNKSPALSYYCFHRDNLQLPAERQKTPQVKHSVLCALSSKSAPKKWDKNYLHERQSLPVIVLGLLFLTSRDIEEANHDEYLARIFTDYSPILQSQKTVPEGIYCHW